MIKDYIEKVQSGKCTKTEITLTAICLFLFGMVIGMMFAPSRATFMGSFNGNTGSLSNPEELKNLISKREK